MSDPKDILGRIFADKKKLQEQVYIDGDEIIINVRTHYAIALKRADTHEKILGWVVHLAEKTWMTQQVTRRFVYLACEAAGLKVPRV